MNNFDDLFEQQPQKEAAPQKPEGQKERPKRQWWQIREEKQRKEAYASLDKIFGAFAEGNGNMEAYLDVQSRFPFHSARNALLIGAQCPQAQRVGGYKEWTAQGIEILEKKIGFPLSFWNRARRTGGMTAPSARTSMPKRSMTFPRLRHRDSTSPRSPMMTGCF